MVEKENGVVQSDIKVLWCQIQICEERTADGVTVTRRVFRQGEQVGAAARFFATDHLGSVTEVTDTTATLLARYAFDPWGRRTLISGTDVTTVGYAGHRWQASGRLSVTLYRGYDPELGRWLSEDPLRSSVINGPNLYELVWNQPIELVDPTGLEGVPRALPPLPTPAGCTRIGLS